MYVNPRTFRVEADEYFSGPYLSTLESNATLKPDIRGLYDEVLENLKTYLVPGRLLDVGCAMGHFMAVARSHGWAVHGVECSSYAAAHGRERFGLKIHVASDLCDARLPSEHYDAVVLIEVVEHLRDPRHTLTEVFRLLKPLGVLYMTTPNFASYRSVVEREDWHAIIPTGHLYYFTGDTLGQLLHSIGFRPIANLTQPASFDEAVHLSRDSRTLRIKEEHLEAIRSSLIAEDAEKLTNQRGEALVMWSVKPVSPGALTVASVRQGLGTLDLDGRLVRVPGASSLDQRVFYVRGGVKHWVASPEWLFSHGMRLSDTIEVSAEHLGRLLTGPPLS